MILNNHSNCTISIHFTLIIQSLHLHSKKHVTTTLIGSAPAFYHFSTSSRQISSNDWYPHEMNLTPMNYSTVHELHQLDRAFKIKHTSSS